MDMTQLPGFGMRSKNSINKDETNVVELIVFVYGIVGKVMGKIESEEQRNKAIYYIGKNVIDRIIHSIQQCIGQNEQGEIKTKLDP